MITDLANHKKLETKCLTKKQANFQSITLEKLRKLEAREPLKIDGVR